jgi:hypothetical protein
LFENGSRTKCGTDKMNTLYNFSPLAIRNAKHFASGGKNVKNFAFSGMQGPPQERRSRVPQTLTVGIHIFGHFLRKLRISQKRQQID